MMQNFRTSLDAFFRGEQSFADLIASLDARLAGPPGPAALLRAEVEGLLREGRLPQQLQAILEGRLRGGASPAIKTTLIKGSRPAQPPQDAATETEASASSYSSGFDTTNSGDFPPAPDEPTVGQVLNRRFELQEELGRGGMSVVFKALDRRRIEAQYRHPYVALKLLNSSFRRHPQSLLALQREASKAQRLKHPNVIDVYDFDKDENDNYFVSMELLSGAPLSRLVRKVLSSGGLEPERALDLVEQMGRGLAAAHNQSPPIVHCDFKPGNVFLTDDGQIKIFDFGIARAARSGEDGDIETTCFDAGILGALTPTYASAEMLAGEDPDPRDDIYALAIVTYELLTGKRPFGRKTTALQALAGDMKPARVKSLSTRQWRGLRRALALKRSERTPSVEELLAELRPERTRAPLVWGAAAVLGALAAAALWPLAIQPRLEASRLQALSSEVETASAQRLAQLAWTSAELTPARREALDVRIGERLIALAGDDPAAALTSYQVAAHLPPDESARVRSAIESLLADRLAEPGPASAESTWGLLAALPPSATAAIHEGVAERLVQRSQSITPADIPALLATIERLPEGPREDALARARGPIIAAFVTTIEERLAAGDQTGASEALARAAGLYPDSRALESAQRRAEAMAVAAQAPPPSRPRPHPGTTEAREAPPQARSESAAETQSTPIPEPGHAPGPPLVSGATARPMPPSDLTPTTEQAPRAGSDSPGPVPAPPPDEEAMAAPLTPAPPPAQEPSPEQLLEESRALARVSEIPPHLIQQALKDLGHYTGTTDGLTGPGTERAIRSYQREQGRSPTGVLDDAATVALIRTAAEAGHPKSQNTLGMMAAEGIGGPRDMESAQRWLETAAEQGDPDAAYNLGVIHRDGRVIAASSDLARHWFERARESGHRRAVHALLELIEQPGDQPARDALARAGEVPPQLIQQALKDLGHYRGVADGLVGPGTRAAIRAYQKALGVQATGELTDAQRVLLVRDAAALGGAGSLNTLGMMAAQGIGVARNERLALDAFRTAAEQGDAYGAYNLAVMYRDGIGVETSLEKARKWLRKASLGGHPSAAEELRALR